MLGDTQGSLWHRYPAVQPGVCPGPAPVSWFALIDLACDPLSSACPQALACTLGPGDISSLWCHDTPAKAEMHKRKDGRVGRRVKRRNKSFWSYFTISGSVRCPQSAVAKKDLVLDAKLSSTLSALPSHQSRREGRHRHGSWETRVSQEELRGDTRQSPRK